MPAVKSIRNPDRRAAWADMGLCGDIKAVQGDSGHAQADMVTEVYGHIIDEDRRKNAERMENAFYNKENLNPDIHEKNGGRK